MNRVTGLEVYITVELEGRLFRPRTGGRARENFPQSEMNDYQGGALRALGACRGWRADPQGEPPEKKSITFVCEGPDARRAMKIIKEVMLGKAPARFDDIVRASARELESYYAKSTGRSSVLGGPNSSASSGEEKRRTSRKAASIGGFWKATVESGKRIQFAQCGLLESYDRMMRQKEQERGLERGALDGKLFFWKA